MEFKIGQNKYGKYALPIESLHRDVPQKILAGKVYEPETIQTIIDNCGTGDIVHAGTYVGDFLPALSGACKGTVWAFEPVPLNYAASLETIKLNDLQNVNLMNAGVSEKKGKLVMRHSMGGKSIGGLAHMCGAKSDGPASDYHTAEVVAIDDIVPEDRHVSVIHLDLENHEQYAVPGAIKTIQRCHPLLILEQFKNVKWLNELGYIFVKKTDHQNANYVYRYQI